jgi:hypothetical protein
VEQVAVSGKTASLTEQKADCCFAARFYGSPKGPLIDSRCSKAAIGGCYFVLAKRYGLMVENPSVEG